MLPELTHITKPFPPSCVSKTSAVYATYWPYLLAYIPEGKALACLVSRVLGVSCSPESPLRWREKV